MHELVATTRELHPLPLRLETLTRHTIWVCFLNPEGYETFMPAHYDNGSVYTTTDQPLPSLKNVEVSSVQFWHDKAQITVVPTGKRPDGQLEFQTVDELLLDDSLPSMTARSLAKRIKMQPYNRLNPRSPIHPLVPLVDASLAVEEQS